MNPFDYRTIKEPEFKDEAAVAMAYLAQTDVYFGPLFCRIHSIEDCRALSSVKADFSKIETLKMRFVGFVSFCMFFNITFGNQAVYSAIGISPGEAKRWESEKSRTREHTEFIRRVNAFCGAYREMMGAAGKLDSRLLIWWQKNYDGLTDTQHVVLQTETVLGEVMTEEEIANRIMLDIPKEV